MRSILSDSADLEARIARLTREFLALKKLAASRGAAAYDDTRENAADLYDDLRERFIDALPGMKQRAKAVEKAARDNPAVAAAVGLVVVGLVAAFLSRR